MKPKLYQYTACPFCCKVRALLHYKRVPYEAIEVHPINKKEIAFSKDYRKVPIFVDEQGIQVNDSSKIMRYIERFYPQNAVFEKGPINSDEETLWLNWSDEKLARALLPLIYKTWGDAYKAFGYITKVGNFNSFQRIGIRLSGTIVMKIVAKKIAKKYNITDPKKYLTDLLIEWENTLKGKDFMGKTRPNGADIAIFGVLESIETLPSFEIIKANTKVYQWYSSLKQLTSLKPLQVR